VSSKRRSIPKNWKRGFDWDGYSTQIGVSSATDFADADWMRVPSEALDPLSGTPDYPIAPKTLIKTNFYMSAATSVVQSGTSLQLDFGIIAWDGIDALVPTEIPDASNPALDWVLWGTLRNFNVSGSALFYQNNFANASDIGGLTSSAMRKLPPNRGLLFCYHFTTSAIAGVTFSMSVAARMGLKGDVTAVGLGGEG